MTTNNTTTTEPETKKKTPNVTINGVNPFAAAEGISTLVNPEKRKRFADEQLAEMRENAAKQIAEIEADAFGTWKCRWCGTKNPESSHTCSECQARQVAWTCGACGTTDNIGDFCDHCGEPFDGDDTVTAGSKPAPTHEDGSAGAVIWAMAAFLICLPMAYISICELMHIPHPGTFTGNPLVGLAVCALFIGVGIFLLTSTLKKKRANKALMKRVGKPAEKPHA